MVAFYALSLGAVCTFAEHGVPDISQFAPLPASPEVDELKVALGRQLFFDPKLSGDATIRCATCHQPEKAWADGLALSVGYPGSLYFRNTPTVINIAHAKLVYWDGRLPAADLPTVVRDHISEAHFMQADGRLVIERIRQVPTYEEGFKQAYGGEPTYGRILGAVSEYMKSLASRDIPWDAYLNGDKNAISPAAIRGLKLFVGKANCANCHSGAMLTDNKFHNLGLATNPDIFSSPERHITFRRFMRTLGVSEYARLRHDVGLFCVTKQLQDSGRFLTPSLREVSRTAPYTHDGSIETLEDVIAFYNQGGGKNNKELKPLDLSSAEQADIVEFLKTLSGKLPDTFAPEPPPYELRTIGEN